ncbi:MAG: SusC/RagA family TonB-linked outer membrane protein [Bacteroidales bacterium]|jgi:TonB-linked SusC/RagA family outer membrane protein
MGNIKSCLFLLLILLLPGWSLTAQTRKIQGVVTDSLTRESLPGVNIQIKGTNMGTTSNPSGKFEITLPAGKGILVFSYIGMERKELTVGTSDYLEVRLRQGIKLDEVIVTAFGISRSAKSLGYAATNIKSAEISESRETNLINALSGKIAGIDISSSSGGVGSSSRILIRGISGLTSDNQPLFVVDGIPVNNTLRSDSGDIDWGNAISDINPEDISEMTVLKGAGAAALYGSQAANGVIIIKTKSGKGKKGLGFEYNTSVSFEEPFRLPSFQNKYGPGINPNGWDFWKSGEEPYYAWGPKLDDGILAVQWNSPLGADGNPIPLPLKSYPNNFRDFFETGLIFNNNLAFSNGEDGKYHYRVSYNDVREKGMLYNTDLKRNVLTLNAGTNITKNIEINTSVIYSKTSSGNRLTGNNDAYNAVKGALFMSRSDNVADLRNYKGLLADGVPLPGEYIGKNPQVVVPGTTMATSDYYPNMFYTLDNLKNQFDNDRLFTVAGISYRITDWLKFDANTSIELINEYYQQKCNDGVRHWNGSIYSYKGFYSRGLTSRNNATTNFKFMLNRDFKVVNVDAFFGGERRDNIMDWGNMYAPELAISGVFNMSNTQGTKEATNGYSHRRVNSLFGSVDLSFKNGIYFTVTGRNDWSSTLPPANRSYFYPSASLSWVTSETFKLPSFISFAKLRINLSQVGSDTWAYQLERSFYNLDRLGGMYEASIENTLKNPNLKPTRTNQFEIGTDIRFFHNRLNFDFAAYTGTSFDQITPVNIASSTGYIYRYVNVGEVSNKGLELAIASVPVKREYFTWDLGLTWSKNINEVISLAEGVDALPIGYGYSGIRTEARPGMAYGNIIGYGLKRDTQGRVVHVNGLPVRTDNEMILGNITPDWLGSISTRVSYRNFSLSALFSGKFGGEIFSLTTQWLRQYGLDEATDVPLRQGAIIGDGVMEQTVNGEKVYVPNNASVLFRDYTYWFNAYGLQETAIFDASYVKLKEARISYSIPAKWLKKLPGNRISLAVVGRNLALLYSRIPHVDPETSISADNSKQGFEVFNMPSARTLSVNLTVIF